MNAEEIIRYISEAPKKTPVKLYVKEKEPIDFGKDARVFGCGDKIVFGDYKDLAPILEANREIGSLKMTRGTALFRFLIRKISLPALNPARSYATWLKSVIMPLS